MKKAVAVLICTVLLGVTGVHWENLPDGHAAVTVEFRSLSETAEELKKLSALLRSAADAFSGIHDESPDAAPDRKGTE